MEYITIENKDFPDKLKNIRNSPKRIYAIGNTKLLYEDSFGIIGTRKISEYGKKVCKYFTKELALRNIPIVSGLATGTDSIAHIETIENRGKTIAVIGNGFGHYYPKENENLYNSIVENDGLIITEYEYNVGALKKNFPKRNRIIAALSEGILVIEAAYRSGTSITAHYAIEQGKKVFAIPGLLDNYLGIGVNNLIKEGAILTTKVDDILEHYPQFMQKKRITIHDVQKINIDVKKEYKDIYNLIRAKNVSLDELLLEINEDVATTLKKVSNMELIGLIKKLDDGRFCVGDKNG